MMTFPGALLRSLAGVVGGPHVLTGDAAEVAAVLALCTGAGVPVVPQRGTPGWSAAACRCTARSC
jgi:FAD/FMN-containing dehydrogenase